MFSRFPNNQTCLNESILQHCLEHLYHLLFMASIIKVFIHVSLSTARVLYL